MIFAYWKLWAFYHVMHLLICNVQGHSWDKIPSMVLYAQVKTRMNYKCTQTIFPLKNVNLAIGKRWLVLFLILVIKEYSVFLPSGTL